MHRTLYFDLHSIEEYFVSKWMKTCTVRPVINRHPSRGAWVQNRIFKIEISVCVSEKKVKKLAPLCKYENIDFLGLTFLKLISVFFTLI
jgi:hypothetical protein